MEIERTADFDENFIFTQKAGEEVRKLVYDYRKCNGCGICVYSCPVGAIELSEIHEIAKGLEMPPVMIDHLKCAYCGICFSFCPFDAYEFYIDGKKIEKDRLAISPVAATSKLENCVECTLCYKVCPTGAIERRIFLRREDIEQKNEIEGKIEIDKEKCNLCGICAEFCEAFKMVEKDVNPDSIMPYDDILIDESKCDYCKLCEKICPEDAIKIEGELIEFSMPEKIAEISVNQELCSYCGYCEKICPYEGIKSIKPTEGKLRFFEARAEKCDPLGCMACVNICKNNRVWWISEGLRFNEEFCIHCGACENSCPYNLIEVTRDCFYTKELIEPPWKEAWNRALERAVLKVKENHEKLRVYPEIPEVIREVPKAKPKKKRERREIDVQKISTYKRIENILKIPAYRKAFEKGNAGILLKVVRKNASGENKGNGEQET